jgi:DNA-directed RNA polymerase specialized sigma24 family protein
VQEAFQLAFVHLQDFEGGACFSTWLSRIAINVALMKFRKKARKVEAPIDEHSESEDMAFRDAVTDLAPSPEQRRASDRAALIEDNATSQGKIGRDLALSSNCICG